LIGEVIKLHEEITKITSVLILLQKRNQSPFKLITEHNRNTSLPQQKCFLNYNNLSTIQNTWTKSGTCRPLWRKHIISDHI